MAQPPLPMVINDAPHHSPDCASACRMRRPHRAWLSHHQGCASQPNGERHLKSPRKMERRSADIPNGASHRRHRSALRLLAGTRLRTSCMSPSARGLTLTSTLPICKLDKARRCVIPRDLAARARYHRKSKNWWIYRNSMMRVNFLTVHDIVRYADELRHSLPGEGVAGLPIPRCVIACITPAGLDPAHNDVLFERASFPPSGASRRISMWISNTNAARGHPGHLRARWPRACGHRCDGDFTTGLSVPFARTQGDGVVGGRHCRAVGDHGMWWGTWSTLSLTAYWP